MVHPVVEKAFPHESFSPFINLKLHLLPRTIYQFNYGVNPLVDERRCLRSEDGGLKMDKIDLMHCSVQLWGKFT